MKQMRTPRGRTYKAVGEQSVLTMDRLAVIEKRFDSDPRIVSVSVVAHTDPGQEFVRATAPAGCTVVVATDAEALTGALPKDASSEELQAWARAASERGLWHDWWISSAPDIARSPVLLEPAGIDVAEIRDPASSRFTAVNRQRMNPTALSITIDGTWLGPHQTGAQVLTTAAIEALARNASVELIRLVGVEDLPTYAQHLSESPKVKVIHDAAHLEATDVLWYPNQIDQRVDISLARTLGRRVITTYLDLIAYDIPRYHGSTEAWGAYRALQRRIALSVDGITTISADVATRLLEEIPRLAPERVQPIPLGLDHISASVQEAGDDISELRSQLGARPFVLVLGNDFQHKNRDFAIEVWESVLEKGINCDLVLAGLHVKSSSSRAREEVLLAQHTNLRGQAHTIGHVSSASREWLLAHAAAVLYPSSAEGFGFVPYEAAALGTPTSFTSFGPLAELSGVTSVPDSWTIEDCGQDVARLLDDPDFAQARVNELRRVIARLTWDRFAQQLIDFCVRIDSLPPVEGSLVGGTAADASALAAVLSSKTWRATAPLRKIGSRVKAPRRSS